MKIITPQHSDTLNLTTEIEPIVVFQSSDTNFSSIEPWLLRYAHLKFKGRATFVGKVKKSQGHISMNLQLILIKIWYLSFASNRHHLYQFSSKSAMVG